MKLALFFLSLRVECIKGDYMGVYIPDMDIPMSCVECPMLMDANDSYGCRLESNGVPDRYFLKMKSFRSRPEWCPLRRAGNNKEGKLYL